MYYIYMIRCKDMSIYTGITNNLTRRMHEHFDKTKKCAKYTKSHTPYKLEAVWETETRSLASKLEYNIKKSLTKAEKENLIKNPKCISSFFDKKIDCSQINIININENKI